MKKSELKFNQFKKDEMRRRHLNALKGGIGTCVCTWDCNCTCSGALSSILSNSNHESLGQSYASGSSGIVYIANNPY